MENQPSYKTRKVITIGIVSELTGLSERQIRYYEERKLVFPERTKKGNRKYSFSDVETLIEIANKREEGVRTDEIRYELNKRRNHADYEKSRNDMIRGQLNARFGNRKK
ncbi:MerR family transcriptional regulator [Bacillaceae bacterium Marseille-Q3522]|nr:MerR family transcriptional regulator [Bacillaceae bacterium Marseille-Q3522]